MSVGITLVINACTRVIGLVVCQLIVFLGRLREKLAFSESDSMSLQKDFRQNDVAQIDDRNWLHVVILPAIECIHSGLLPIRWAEQCEMKFYLESKVEYKMVSHTK